MAVVGGVVLSATLKTDSMNISTSCRSGKHQWEVKSIYSERLLQNGAGINQRTTAIL